MRSRGHGCALRREGRKTDRRRGAPVPGAGQMETECCGVRRQGGGRGPEGRMQKCYATEENVRDAEEDSHRRVCTKGSAWTPGRFQGVTLAGPGSKSQPSPQDVTMGHRWAGKGETSMCGTGRET